MSLAVVGVILALACVTLAVRMAVRCRAASRIYWSGCGLLLSVGLLGIAAVFAFPPKHFDEAGDLIGEMPPEFGVSAAFVALGLVGTGVGCIGLAGLRLYQGSRGKR